MDDDRTYDLAILHIVDGGPDHGRRLRLTRKAESGEIGHDLVFEFQDADMVEDLIEQLRVASAEVWGHLAD